MRVLAEQQVILKELVESNRNIWRVLKSIQNSRENQVLAELPENLVLPLKTTDEVIHQEERLADDAIKQSLVRKLCNVFL